MGDVRHDLNSVDFLSAFALMQLPDHESFVVDFGSSVTKDVAVSFPVEHMKQMYLKGVMSVGASKNLLRVDFEHRQGTCWRQTYTNQLGGHVVFVPATTGATAVYTDFSVPQPLLEPQEKRTTLRQTQYRFSVTDVDGAAVTYTRLVLFLAFVRSPQEERVRIQPLSSPLALEASRMF